jgi:UDP-GlcNAc:undecaprenyl-phosphate GlcNAc-1-phosphate transferase
MTLSVLLFFGCMAALTLLGGLAYRRLWRRWRGLEVTPTGFGVFLAPALLAAAVVFRAPSGAIAAFAIIAAAAAVYWLDDLRGLGIRFRIAISFAAGAAVCACLLADGQSFPWSLLIVSCVAAGVLNVVLTTMVNFYDGADLNIATLIGLCSLTLLVFAPADAFVTSGAVACVAFIVPFAVLNSRPRIIYFGDSGSFVFASFLTIIAIVYFKDGNLPAQVVIPMALPAFDTFYVLCIRITAGHDLKTRNYLHLYQRLSHHKKGFGYLAPQIVNAGLVLAMAAALQAAGLKQLVAVVAAMVLVTVPFYFACRKLLLSEDSDGGPA